MEDALEKTIEYTNKMLTALVNVQNKQAELLKSMVLDLGWFDRDQMKFENWQRSMQLFFKSNRVIVTNNKITIILAWFRGGTASIYAQKKIDQIKYYNNI